ncbi:MAG: hypothetical protein OIF58_15490 [Cohaesibacter sp.]|nr:hypothetical protein [Cohaesibacter sp.]
MKKLVLSLSLIAAASLASGAQAMTPKTFTSTKHSTSQLQSIVKQHGAVILRTSSSTFDRYVANRSHCSSSQRAKVAYVPTADSSNGFIGYRCVDKGDKSK